jgi:hypothetical protein
MQMDVYGLVAMDGMVQGAHDSEVAQGFTLGKDQPPPFDKLRAGSGGAMSSWGQIPGFRAAHCTLG